MVCLPLARFDRYHHVRRACEDHLMMNIGSLCVAKYNGYLITHTHLKLSYSSRNKCHCVSKDDLVLVLDISIVDNRKYALVHHAKSNRVGWLYLINLESLI